MNISIEQSIPFQKKQVAECAVKRYGFKTPCKIFEIERNNPQDDNYFSKLRHDKNWAKSYYLTEIERLFSHVPPFSFSMNIHFYSLENKRGKCLGTCLTNEGSEKSLYINILEAAPKFKNSPKNKSHTKYIGQTLLAFVSQLAKKNNIKNILLTPNDESPKYYLKQGFIEYNTYLYMMEKSQFEKLIQNNAKKVGKKVTLV